VFDEEKELEDAAKLSYGEQVQSYMQEKSKMTRAKMLEMHRFTLQKQEQMDNAMARISVGLGLPNSRLSSLRAPSIKHIINPLSRFKG